MFSFSFWEAILYVLEMLSDKQTAYLTTKSSIVIFFTNIFFVFPAKKRYGGGSFDMARLVKAVFGRYKTESKLKEVFQSFLLFLSPFSKICVFFSFPLNYRYGSGSFDMSSLIKTVCGQYKSKAMLKKVTFKIMINFKLKLI